MADRATWAKRVGAWRASGQTAARFCEGRDFSAATLRWWSSELGTTGESARSPVRMARVVRRPARVTGAIPSGDKPIVVEVGGARVSVVAGFDEGVLAAVLAVLSGRGGSR